MNIMHIKRVSRLTSKDMSSLAHIFFLYLKYQFIVQFLPLKYYKHNFNNCSVSNNSMQLIRRDLRLIKGVRSFLPFRPRCLVDSLVIRNYFRRMNLDIPILLGVQNNTSIKAHAWCEGLNANGYNQNIFLR